MAILGSVVSMAAAAVRSAPAPVLGRSPPAKPARQHRSTQRRPAVPASSATQRLDSLVSETRRNTGDGGNNVVVLITQRDRRARYVPDGTVRDGYSRSLTRPVPRLRPA